MADDPKPCPLCGAELRAEYPDVWVHRQMRNMCPLSGLRIRSRQVKRWNDRCVHTPLQAQRDKLVEALRLAASRLHRCSVDYDAGTRQFIEVGEWAEEARAAIAEAMNGST